MFRASESKQDVAFKIHGKPDDWTRIGQQLLKEDPVVSNYDAVLTAAVCSSEWSIENAQLKCDIVSIDNTLQNNYDSHFLNGGKLPISYNTYICQSQAVSGTDLSVNVSRAISRLKSVFVSFYKSEYKDAAGAVVVNPMTASTRK